jgi:lipid-binding SYLF domain-containing protein
MKPIALVLMALALIVGRPAAAAESGSDIDRDSRHALDILYRSNPAAASLSKGARAVLVFPKIVKAGLVFGGSYGEGELLKGGRRAGFYSTASASWGLQAGAQSYGYAVFLMTEKAEKYIHKTDGWEVGVGPTVVIVDEGAAKNLSTSTLKDDAYAFIFDQEGLMAGISLEGSKITSIKR